MNTGIILRGVNWQGHDVGHSLYVALRLRMSEDILLLSLYAFVAWVWTTFPV
jgi:hypothetical protein